MDNRRGLLVFAAIIIRIRILFMRVLMGGGSGRAKVLTAVQLTEDQRRDGLGKFWFRALTPEKTAIRLTPNVKLDKQVFVCLEEAG
ncbi:hypothetical protein [uncultured Meiothermus sp.]|jgi:hypothetical protein|uniref:hypothetical protein n=1 Tax=uncultured Meiothermus sp. TaxID=157471 RepID=UPI002618C931|nr:hypothetical protein [uncultured Meiothermus sp.]